MPDVTRNEFLQTLAGGALGLNASAQTAAPATFTYKTVGSCEIRADVYGTAEGAEKPALMWIHGGALIFGNRKNPSRLFREALLQSGFVVVSIDYRLAPETKLPSIIEDVQDAYKWIRDHSRQLGIHRDRIAVAGGSAGGYLTQMAGFRLEPRPRALVSYYGYGDIVGPWYSEPDEYYRRAPLVAKEEAYRTVGTTPISDPPESNSRDRFYLYCRQNGLWPKEVTGHDPRSEPKWFDRYCPIRNVTAQYSPIVLIHGTIDTDVPYSLSKDMDAKLTSVGVEHEFITVTGAGHGLGDANPEELAMLTQRAVNFVKRHTA